MSISVYENDLIENGVKKAVTVEISDSGKGICENIKEKLFDPYFTSKDHGTGMGLAIAKKIIEDHRGSITFYSKENFGTTFSITLPIEENEKS
ncbi:MAG: hypothetical protein K9N07_09830 [Candidatus Cloacimonetes bacterium]|nr:hypothetical protein [Candidatus Cloacimonadota bacterium]